jgi:hypothetical protein
LLAEGYRTPDLVRGKDHGFKVLSTHEVGEKVREKVKQLLAASR